MGRRLKKGVKGIQIIYPIKRTYKTEIEGQDSLIKGEPKEQTIEYLIYRPTYVYIFGSFYSSKFLYGCLNGL